MLGTGELVSPHLRLQLTIRGWNLKGGVNKACRQLYLYRGLTGQFIKPGRPLKA
jgi:hypothetical protein